MQVAGAWFVSVLLHQTEIRLVLHAQCLDPNSEIDAEMFNSCCDLYGTDGAMCYL